MQVIKRDKKSNLGELVPALRKLADLLTSQGEEEAVRSLQKFATELESIKPDDAKALLREIQIAFDEDYELGAYILERQDSSEWSESAELSQAASRVSNLLRRLK